MSINGRYFKTIANIIKINEFLKIGKPNISFALKKTGSFVVKLCS